MDGVLVANEVLDEIKSRKKSCVFFKSDFEKAYDSERWEFIYYMLERLDFCGKWICWIKGCLESASVSVLVNGSPSKEFFLEKRTSTRQPINPFFVPYCGGRLGRRV